MKDIQDAEDQWLLEDRGTDIIEGILIGLLIMTIGSTVMVQLFKWGQRHPDPAKFVTYAAAVEVANEREMLGRSHCK